MAKTALLRNVQTRIGTQDSHSVNVQVKDIPTGDIVIRENVRKDYTGIEELTGSIRQHGLLQPITVYADGDQYIVKTGHRRFMAYQCLYQTEPERFHSIRCIISNAENVAVIQLVENVQREDLSQIDLYNALSSLREQSFTLKQIAEAMGKSEWYIKSLFTGINEIQNDETLQNAIGVAGNTIRDVVETSGIPDKEKRLKLLEQRGKGEITRAEMRHKAKALKEDDPANKEVTRVSARPQTLPFSPRSAFTIAKERLDQYILDMVGDKGDLALWEFYTWLLAQAKQYKADRSGFASEGYKADNEEAKIVQ